MEIEPREQLSALADDELSESELGRVLNGIRGPENLRAWERYHLIRDGVHRNLAAVYPHNLAERVRQAIEAEETLNVRPAARIVRLPPTFWRQASGLAVAASVTAVAILGFQQVTRTGQETAPVVVATAGVAGAQTDEAPNSAKPDPKIDSYLVRHNAYSASSGMQGMLPYVRIVSHK